MADQTGPLKVGAPAPDFELMVYNGNALFATLAEL